MRFLEHSRAALLPLHDALVSAGGYARHRALACLDKPSIRPRTRHAARPDTTQRMTGALKLLDRAAPSLCAPRGRS